MANGQTNSTIMMSNASRSYLQKMGLIWPYMAIAQRPHGAQ
jgi:hypothetical protein